MKAFSFTRFKLTSYCAGVPERSAHRIEGREARLRVLIPALCVWLFVTQAATAQGDPRQLSRLHDSLRLAGQQELAWRDYEAAVQPNPQREARREAMEQLLPRLPTPRRIALMAAAMRQDTDDVQRQTSAVLTFYGQLTHAQQKTFDRLTASMAADRSQN
jgi:aminopeptidase N